MCPDESGSRFYAGGCHSHSARRSRVGIFTDAIFAIAMTLLVIEIPRPGAADLEAGGDVTKAQAVGRLWQFLVDQRNDFFAYALAFSLLWIVWREHHTIFSQVSRVSATMISLHFPLLLLAAFLPYATTVMGHYPDNPLAALLLGLVIGALLVCRSAIQSQAARDDVLLPEVGARMHRADVTVSWIVTGYWALTLVLVWWTPWVEIPWSLTVAVGAAGRMISRRSAAGEADQVRTACGTPRAKGDSHDGNSVCIPDGR